jgi:hypothetical protein
MHTVHVRVNDAAGKPTPVRIRFLDAAGVYHAPLGRLADFATAPGEDVGGNVRLGAEPFAYIDGTCEVRLPAGPLTVELSKGPEHAPLVQHVNLGPGKLALRLTLERWTDLRPEGWYAGDTRVHELTPHAAALEGAAEGLAVVNLLARDRPPSAGRPPAVSGILAFSGTQPAMPPGACLVAVNTLNSHPILGTVSLLNCHRAVYPLSFGNPPEPDNWSVADWCDQCHRKAGLVVWPDLRLTDESPQGEALAALLLGKIDAYEVSLFPDPEPAVLGEWYRLLDCGLRLPLVGGSGKDSNAVALGCVRTYARLEPGQELSYAAWIEAVRAGRTFVTNGPLLSLSVDGQGPGAVLPVPAGRAVRLRAEAHSAIPFDQLEVLASGTLVAAKPASGNRQSAVLETELTAPVRTWVAARCWGQEALVGGAGRQCVYAHTAPVYLEGEGPPTDPDADTVAPLLAVLDRTLTWVAEQARCENDRQRQHLAEVLQAGRQELLRRCGRPAE